MNMHTIITMILSYESDKRDEIDRLKERIIELEEMNLELEDKVELLEEQNDQHEKDNIMILKELCMEGE